MFIIPFSHVTQLIDGEQESFYYVIVPDKHMRLCVFVKRSAKIPDVVWPVRENREVLSGKSRNPAAGPKLRLGRTLLPPAL